MPVVGPTWDESAPLRITEDILAMLKIKHNIHNTGMEKPNSQWDFDEKLKKQLLDVITEIVKTDAWNGW